MRVYTRLDNARDVTLVEPHVGGLASATLGTDVGKCGEGRGEGRGEHCRTSSHFGTCGHPPSHLDPHLGADRIVPVACPLSHSVTRLERHDGRSHLVGEQKIGIRAPHL